MKHIEVVCAIVRNEHGEVLCCKRGPGRAHEGMWEFPGGKVEPSESHEQAIVREIKEELKTTIEPIRYLSKSYYEYTDLEKPFSITMYAYECKLIEGNFELTEHTAKKWLKIKDLETVELAPADLPIKKFLRIFQN